MTFIMLANGTSSEIAVCVRVECKLQSQEFYDEFYDRRLSAMMKKSNSRLIAVADDR